MVVLMVSYLGSALVSEAVGRFAASIFGSSPRRIDPLAPSPRLRCV
jgi:hypothetical protein